MTRQTTRIPLYLILLLLACSATARSEPAQKPLPSAQEMARQATALGNAAWERARQHGAEAGDIIQKKSRAYCEAAREQASEALEAIAEKSKSYYKTVKEQSEKYLEQAAEAAADLAKTVKEKADEHHESGKKTPPPGEMVHHTI